MLSNELIHKFYFCSANNLLIISANEFGLENDKAYLPLYSGGDSSDNSLVRAHFMVFPSTGSKLEHSSAQSKSMVFKENCKGYQKSKAAKKIANKLHGFSHLAVHDMKDGKRIKLLSPSMEKALKVVYNNCSSGKPTNRLF